MIRFIAIWILTLGGWLISGCDLFESADNGSGSDVEATIVSGKFVDSNGVEQAGITVRLREESFLAKKSSDEPDTRAVKHDVTTGKKGQFKFSGLKTGRYCIEANKDDQLGSVIKVTVSKSQKQIQLPPDTLSALVTVTGKVDISVEDKGNPQEVVVQVYGVDRQVSPDTSGEFEFKLPKGDYKMRVADESVSFDEVEKRINVHPDKPSRKHRFHLGERCQDFDCDYTTVRELLDYIGLDTVKVADVTRTKDNRIIEVYLRDRGLARMPFKLVKLERLEVLDLGRNFITKIMLKPLKNLKTLNLDGNEIVKIRNDIGGLDSLNQLDLSDNNLVDLPDSISALHLEYLNLSNNMLCDVSGVLAQWADKYDPGWRDRQRCE